MALYVRAGMTPRWPMVWLRAHTAQLGRLPSGGVTVAASAEGNPEILRRDAAIGGRQRPEELRYWVEEGALPVWRERAGARIGYDYLHPRSCSALWSRDAVAVGPLGTRIAADATDAVCAAIEHARTRREVVRMAIPGPHPALPELLAAGFRITDLGTFLSAPPVDLFDPTRYLPSDDFL